MNWTPIRLLTYLAMFGAGLFAASGMADFDAATGDFDLHPVNIYQLSATVSALVSSAMASLAVIKKWGRK